MTFSLKRILSVSFALLALGILSRGDLVFAQKSSTLSVSPVTFELTANPGDTLHNQIKVTNLSDTALQLETRVENIASTGQQGQVQLTEESTSYSLNTWVKTTPSNFSLAAKESKIIDFTINVPANAEPGGHYGSILVGTVATDQSIGTGAIIAQRIGSLMLVRVAGQAQEQAQMTGFAAHPFSGQTETVTTADGKTKVVVPVEKERSTGITTKYIQTGPIAFDIDVKNLGNVHVKPIGFITVHDLFGRKVAELPIDQRNVFPGSTRHTTVIWPTKQLWGIYYRANYLATYGNNDQQLTYETSFWGFPLPVAIGIVIFLVLVLLARRRLAAMFRVLIKGH